MQDRRKYLRVDTSKLNIMCKKIDSADSSVESDKTRNISEDGIRLIFDQESVKPGDILQLEFVLPETKATIACKGKVVWMEEFEILGKEYEKNVEAGIEFIDIRNEDKMAIRQFIFSIITP